jgi:hypothetical protein
VESQTSAVGLGWVFGHLPTEDRGSVKRFQRLVHYSQLSIFLGGASVNLDHCNVQVDEQILAVAAQNQNLVYARPRIERCEFENLLERAMEILSARAKSASSPHA